MKQINFVMDGHELVATEGQTILQAALDAEVYIPHLCYHPSLPHASHCKLCVVEIEGEADSVTSCSTPVTDGMCITTKNERLNRLRQLSMELMLASHPSECTACPKYLKCELQALTQYLGVSDSRLRKLPINEYITHENPLFIRDLNRCVLCGRCVRACQNLRGADVLDFHRDGVKTWVAPKKGDGLLKDGDCRFCGACVEVCPTGAIRDKDDVFAGFEADEQAFVPCRSRCPAGTDVPRYLALLREGDHSGALAVIREKVPLPLTLGHICMRFCEDACRRNSVNDAINIRELKKIAAEYGGNLWKEYLRKANDTGKRVAVVGSGPAGLTVAYYLARKGHHVDLYEELPAAGGMLRFGIPSHRLPVDVVEHEVEEILNAGVCLHLNVRADAPKALLQNGYNSVVLAIGAHKGRRLPIPGNCLDGVMTATEFLRYAALGKPMKIGERVIILGGGNVAFDCAGTAKRLGVRQVTVACLEARDKMTASEEEVLEALNKGVELLNGCAFERIESEESLAVVCSNVKYFSLSEGKLEKQPNSEHRISVDNVIFATGQMPDCPESYGIALTPAGLLEADTGLEGVFAAGDAVSGTASVIQAIASGRDTAQIVDLYLGGDGVIDEALTAPTVRKPWIGYEEGFVSRTRCVDVSDDARMVCEAGRCLQCDLRLQIPKVKFWNEYTAR